MEQFAAEKESLLCHQGLNLMQSVPAQWVDVTGNKRPVTTDNTDVHLSSDFEAEVKTRACILLRNTT